MARRIDLYTLQLFLAVIEEGSIAAAAEREHIAASALSKRIADLEKRLDVTLLLREARGVQPTHAGDNLARGARDLLHNASNLVDSMGAIAEGVRGHVRLAANMSSITEFLADDLGTFLTLYPDVTVDLREMVSQDVVRAVYENKADIGIFTQSDNLYDLITYPYRTDEMVLITPRGHPLATRDQVTFAEVLPYDHVGMHRGSASNHLLMREASNVNQTLRLRFQVTSYDALISMVSAGLGVAILPSKSANLYRQARFRTVALNETWAARQLKICVKPSNNHLMAAQRLLRHLQRDAQANGDPRPPGGHSH